MLGIVAHSIAVSVRLDLVDLSDDVVGRPPFAGGFVAFDDAQAFALYPAEPLDIGPSA
jgi:hypothetical protein